MRRALARAAGGVVCGFGTLVVLLTLRPVGQTVMLRLRQRENPAAFDRPAVAASVALAILLETAERA